MTGFVGSGTTYDPVRIFRQREAIVGKRYAALLRTRYHRAVRSGALNPIDVQGPVDTDLITFSCERDVPEQIACLRSFYRNVGLPASTRVISDGSITSESARLIEGVAPGVSVVSVESYTSGVPIPDPIQRFADTKVYGKKLACLFATSGTERPVVYSDSDVLFYPGAAGLSEVLNTANGRALFLEDYQPALDVRLVDATTVDNPLNSGFLIIGKNLDWSRAAVALDRAGEPDAPGYGWTEQTVVHIAYHDSGGEALPRDRCVLEESDRYHWRDPHESSALWLRHFVTGLRYKFWLAVGRLDPPNRS